MATNRWVGGAAAFSQNTYITPASVATGNVYQLTMNGKSVQYVAIGGDTVALVIAGLVVAATASTAPPEFTEVTWTSQTTYLLATALTPGVPFTVTATAFGGTATITVQNGLATPVASGLSASGSGGTLTNATTYFYRVSALNAFGESLASTEVSQATPGGPNTCTVTIPWAAISGATSYRVYGRTTGAELLLANAGNVLTFTDTGALTPAGALPTINTSVNSGPNDVAVPSNWSTGAIPVAADDIFLQGSSSSLLYSLSALAAVTPTSITIDATFTGQIGLPYSNPNGYVEYRPRYLQFTGSSGNVIIGRGSGSGSGKIQLDFQGGNYTAFIWNTATSSETGVPALLLKGGSGATTLYVMRGSVGVAVFAGETANLSGGLNISYVTNVVGDATVTCGPGATLATINKSGGTLTVNSAVTTLTQYAGTFTQQKGNIATFNLYENSAGNPNSVFIRDGITVTTNVVQKGCVLDCSGTLQTVTLTNSTWYAGATITAPAGNLVMTNAASVPDGVTSDVTINMGVNKTVKVT